MNYVKYTITDINATMAEIITCELADLGFESFSEYDELSKSFDAFVQENFLTPETNAYLTEENIKFSSEKVEQQNWNAQWESNFSPIEVDERCYIRATFHEPKPHFSHEIIITPKMSFGTGHHPTTHLVVEALLDSGLKGKTGLDMGSGTGILAILAAQLGAVEVDAIDIDDWAYENAMENIALNNVEKIVKPILGDASAIPSNAQYDFIVANINRNILLEDMHHYTKHLKSNGTLSISGFLEFDAEILEQKALELGLQKISFKTRDGWVGMTFAK